MWLGRRHAVSHQIARRGLEVGYLLIGVVSAVATTRSGEEAEFGQKLLSNSTSHASLLGLFS